MTPPPRDRALFRARAERALRTTLDDLGLVEIATPTLVENPGLEPHLRAFPVVAAECAEVDGRWLHTSPEYAIKATLAELGHDVYTLARCYRDEPPTRWHHPEFTMLEWYRLDAPWTALMDDCERILRALVAALGPADPALGRIVDRPFERLALSDAFARTLGVAVDADPAVLAAACDRAGIDVDPSWDWETLFSVAWAEAIEPTLTERPVFLTGFPAAMAALARLCPDDPATAERFELYLPRAEGGLEVANAFGELVDADEQRRRFDADLRRRSEAGADAYPMPEPLLAGLAELPLTSGIALGWERVLCWLAERCRGWTTGVRDWLVGEPLR